jgi:inosose dehydratase
VPRAPFVGGDLKRDVPRPAFEQVAGVVNQLAAAAKEYGVRIALHTDAYSVCSRNQDIAEMLALTDPESVTLCLDAGHTTLDGGDAVAALAQNVNRTPVMHWKDCTCPFDGSQLSGDQMEKHAVMLTHFRILGSGSIDWHSWQKVLRDAHWSGWAMAENDMAGDPIAEIKQALEYFDRELAPIYK